MAKNIAPSTIAAQRADLLRHVVLNRPSDTINDRDLFHAETGSLVHAYMADHYAAALAAIDPAKAEEVAQQLADHLDAGALPVYAWHRAVELGHDPQEWHDQAAATRAQALAAKGRPAE